MNDRFLCREAELRIPQKRMAASGQERKSNIGHVKLGTVQ